MCDVAGFCRLAQADDAAVDGQALVEWRFDQAGQLQDWSIGGGIADGAVRDGALHGRATGGDPILTGPVFEIAAAPYQFVEVCLKGTAPAVAELFWTETLDGPYGGFSQEKYRKLHTQGDGQYHVYRVWPFWHAADKIVRLRFDPPSAGEFDIQWIRIGQRPTERSTEQTWHAAALQQQWFSSQEFDGDRQGPILLSPQLSIPAADNSVVCVRIKTSTPGSGRLFCVSSRQFGWESVAFPLRADGKPHSYNILMNGLKHWRDEIIALGLQVPADGTGKTMVESIAVASEPRGPAELDVAYFGPADGIQRAGHPIQVSCTLQNLGGETAADITATLHVPNDIKVLDGATRIVDRLSLDLNKTVHWQVAGETVGRRELKVEVTSPGITAVTRRSSLNLTPAPQVPRASYVPEPQPVRSNYEIGAFYFPGFPTMSQWQPILNYPNRKPILGWYDESNPECADWQIKWAVEHGINFFMVDWYWCQGNRQLEHWLHNAYGKARYRKYLKWCVMWANHNPPDTHSADDWREVTQYWIDNYFSMPEYYRIENRPAVFIWAPDNVRRDVGGTDAAAKLQAMSQEMAKQAGYEGIYFVAMSAHDSPDRTKLLLGEGYEAATTYHGFQLAWQRAQSDRFPYADLLTTCPDLWREAEESAAGLLYLPIVDTGWDARPWHGEKSLVAYGRTPELLGDLCRLARQYADRTGKKIIALGPVNEWGEGSYIEPYAQYGFEDLDQVRAAFCEPGDWPPNLIPSDVGLGPYDLPVVEAKTTWEFDEGDSLQGWSSNGQFASLAVRDGCLQGRSTGRDPVLQVPGLQVEASRLQRLALRVRCSRDQRLQIFWATTLAAMSEETSLAIPIRGDGQFHDYQIDMGQSRYWRGIVKVLRIDPVTERDVEFALDYVRLE